MPSPERKRLIESLLELPEDEIPVLWQFITSRRRESLHREIDALSESALPHARLVVKLTIEFDTELLKQMHERWPGQSDSELLEDLIRTELARKENAAPAGPDPAAPSQAGP